MTSMGLALLDVLALVNTAQCKEDLLPAVDQTDTILRQLSSDLQDWRELQCRLHRVFDALPHVPAKPSKKRPRTVKPRTSTRRKA